jgi:large conductance mechanosensitive channel
LKLTLKEQVLDAAGAVVTPAVTWNYGAFIQQVVDFTILALCVFMMVKMMTKLMKKEEAKPAAPAPAPAPSKEEVLLTEIRDLLKEKK